MNENPGPFNPAAHGFIFLPTHRPPGGVRYYEFKNHASVDGNANLCRLNLYLAQDRDFFTIWFGLLEPYVVDGFFEANGMEPVTYDEPLFRGYIDSNEQARHILTALRPGSREPQMVINDAMDGISCRALEP